MAKQMIISAMEEVFGEYILNMSKENLKIAALRGKIKLENVQLDGDLIGGHVMGVLGLHGFGILSCYAKSLHISVPWKNLENEPTKFEIRGLHLICVPLTPTTANKIFGTGSRTDPQCKLRTKVKRLLLARFERNFWNGLIENEGPPLKRVSRAVQDVERDFRRKSRRAATTQTTSPEDMEIEQVLDDLLEHSNESVVASVAGSGKTSQRDSTVWSADIDDLAHMQLPRDWKVKLREKVMRNMEAAIYDMHIRCEASEGDYEHYGGYNNRPQTTQAPTQNADESPFVFGVTVESFIVRTANENWQVGSHDKRNPIDGSAMSSEQGHLGPNPYLVKNNKIGFFNGVSVYWDDQPPFMLNETDLLQGNFRKVGPDKVQAKIAAAMDRLYHGQEPGTKIRESLGELALSDKEVPHEYVCKALDAEVRVRQSDRTLAGAISCSADVLPLDFTFSVRPHQYIQYNKLQKAVRLQQRFDTMLHQRPDESPLSKPRSWWQYAIACVVSRPNSRPWADVQVIVAHRKRYIELIGKKNKKGYGSNVGYHSGLSEKESAELLGYEDLLPVEALESFHLLALRRVYESQKGSERSSIPPSNETSSLSVSASVTSVVSSFHSASATGSIPPLGGRDEPQSQTNSGRFRRLGGSGRRKPENYRELRHAEANLSSSIPVALSQRATIDLATRGTKGSLALLDAMSSRLGKKKWYVDWKIHDAIINVEFIGSRSDAALAQLTFQGGGNVRSFGKGKRDSFFEVTRVDMFHASAGRVLFFQPGEGYDSQDEDWNSEESVGGDGTVASSLSGHSVTSVLGPDLVSASRFLALPQAGVVCRIAAGKDFGASKVSISAHPATLIWTPTLFESILEFFRVQYSDEFQSDVAQRIRNAATPLARKAQLALLSPILFSFHLNVSAPKVFIPIRSRTSDGSLFIDAGTFKLACIKDEGETDLNFDVTARDIRVLFIRDKSVDVASDFSHFQSLMQTSERFRRQETPVIHPFNVCVEAKTSREDRGFTVSRAMPVIYGPVRCVDVVVSPVSVNLVDAEVLARAFGKWYARVIHSIRSQTSTQRASETPRAVYKHVDDQQPIFAVNIPRVVSLTIDKVEMALEGHSRVQGAAVDDRSMASLETLHEVAPSTRTYLIELHEISVRYTRHDESSATSLSVADAGITRLKDGSLFVPLKGKSKITDYCILEGAKRWTGDASNSIEELMAEQGPCILRASFLHDGRRCYDEVEVEIDSVILRVTPMTLKDCTKAARQVAELAQIVTKELERKVHEEGRKARRRGRNIVEPSDSPSFADRPPSPAVSDTMTTVERSIGTSGADSSILFKVTLNESTLLAGRPTLAIEKSSLNRDRKVSFAVLQVLGNALIMFQSIENPDASGSKTLHMSVENVSSLVNTEFERVDDAPMIGPFAAEFRVVYSTENFGSIVSQSISLDCGGIKSCLTPNDASIIVNIFSKMLERLKGLGSPAKMPGEATSAQKAGPLSSIIRYQKRGAGILTRARLEIQSISFVLLKAYKSISGAPEFLDFRVNDLKCKLEGCMSALSGDCSALISVNMFNAEVEDWDFAIEPFPAMLNIDLMPNDLVFDLSSTHHINLNFTGLLLKEIAQLRFDIARDRSILLDDVDKEGSFLTPSALSTVGLRRATESRSICITNSTGVDIHVASDTSTFDFESTLIQSGVTQSLAFGVIDGEATLSLHLSPSTVDNLGNRESIHKLQVGAAHQKTQLLLLRPKGSYDCLAQAGANLFDGFNSGNDDSEEVAVLENHTLYHTAEPVVEWCMENQRLRPSIVDVYSLEKGRDLLSNSFWSPEDAVVNDSDAHLNMHFSLDEENVKSCRSPTTSPERIGKSTATRNKCNWLKPYLNNDSPDWTDMTCTLRMARERVMLPDTQWMWVNEWAVDLSGDCSDADGWEYSADFETFTRSRKNYERGDNCRRRRWIRTRIVKPCSLRLRPLKLVWEATENEQGNFSISIRSPVRCKNRTGGPLSLFLYCPSWEEDVSVGTLRSNEDLCVPVDLASAVYMRLARKLGSKNDVPSIRECTCTERFCILPTSHTSSSFIRVMMQLSDVSQTTLNFVVNVVSKHGVVDIIIEPVLRLINLLPCRLECQFGELLGSDDSRRAADKRPVAGRKVPSKRIGLRESFGLETGKECACTAIMPWRTPHVSLRVPGYEWSPWQRIVNRTASDNTWRPTESEEDCHLYSKEDSELKTYVQFDRVVKGDHLRVILSVECGHCPTIRVYCQYWILDKTGFGCRFSEGFTDLLSSRPDLETSRRSHLVPEEGKQPAIRRDMNTPGHEWSIGMSGMTMYFSKREKLTLVIETGVRGLSRNMHKVKSQWISPLDISNVVPKTVFSVHELNGSRQFELCITVTVCPGLFGRTRLITLLPRYQIVNLLHRELLVAQDGCLSSASLIPSQSAVPFHWDKASLPPNIRIGAPTLQDKARGLYQHSRCWTVGCFHADRVGITSLRLPTGDSHTKISMVAQAEVRLASKDQSSAVVIVVSVANEKSNPLYVLRNRTQHRILCRQPLRNDATVDSGSEGVQIAFNDCTGRNESRFSRSSSTVFQCANPEIGPLFQSLLGLKQVDEFTWILDSNEVATFGFDDPEKAHVLEWTSVKKGETQFEGRKATAVVEVDDMASSSVLSLPDGKSVLCLVKAEHSTKVIEFTEFDSFEPARSISDSLLTTRALSPHHQAQLKISVAQFSSELHQLDEDEDPAFSLRISLPGLAVSVVDNALSTTFGREFLLIQLDKIFFSFSQTREGYHEFEFTLFNFQVDNHVHKSVHPVLLLCPRTESSATENVLHMSAVRRLQKHSSTFVFRYAAIRLLGIEVYLDRRSAECVAHFIEPLITAKEDNTNETPDWILLLTTTMSTRFARPESDAPREIEKTVREANTGRIYFEQLHLHPVRIGLTFTQEWMDSQSSVGHETMMVFQFIRGMASIANAPLVFTSFVVSHVFEAPETLAKTVVTHYSSQLTNQIFKLLGSLAILGAPADFIANVGTGVRDFFYEPIQGAVLGPKEFIQGLDRGTQSLVRGLFVGVVRGTANVTEAVNSNLAGLTADEDFIDERKAHQRMLTDAMSRGLAANRSLEDSVSLAGASIVRSIRSGALGMLEQPSIYASKYGPAGFVQGLGKGFVGAIVKPIVGVGDAAVLVMNHMSDATSKTRAFPKIPKRLRRALPCRSTDKPNCVRLEPYDEKAAKAQKIVTGGESVEDVYLGHLNIPSHLIISSDQCLWAIDRRSRDPWCVSWEEISHFGPLEGGVRVVVFSQMGLKSYLFDVDNKKDAAVFLSLLALQKKKMGNSSDLNSSILNAGSESLSRHQIPGIKAPQVNHVFGSCNQVQTKLDSSVTDEIDLVEQCFARISEMGSDDSTYLRALDEEAWSLVCNWGQVFSGLSSRRCIVASLINGTGGPIQIKSTKLMEGGSPCYSIPTKEFDSEQGVLHAGGVCLFFGWSAVLSLLQPGHVFMHIETNAFIGDFSDEKSRDTYAESMPGYQVGFLEKSYDEFGWWAKYWLLVRAKK